MHNPTILQFMATDPETALQEPQASQSDSKNWRRLDTGGDVLTLPPDRDKLAADLRMINRQFFLMMCEMQRGMLVHLSSIPRKLLMTAERLVKPEDMESCSESWSKTLALYLEALTDGRQQVLAASRLHGAGANGLETAAAINAVEKAVPTFLQAMTEFPTDRGALTSAAKTLCDAARELDKILTGLLEAVELSIERAKANGGPNRASVTPRSP